ncbi:amidohydrolase family protein [Bradyrhizobium sp. 180]|uniref:amidohydrolase family protein n=1 Tax=unclassified Bradyrhizobium TaxID=2631580 RepID=UPI001FF9D7BA|nr:MULTISPECIES: amidohydrolase family protein [unclassified Bradyrhizobium]MCK1491648.1 amidohydrolase family protein [Bradyrhizobium sp. 180]MCK1596579.1 amidohydrolase family protein [Bradyrhizobium sp. 164]MCK1619995.1 amidohydrolase family protein [Bradyrhizobium sp. 159]MCK1669564.1 amidohydrolase family protein [Bradyrhizobium sp. 153]MCK1759782.1 amidohydrolase family protein [Bradyrhizobium sp. 137]
MAAEISASSLFRGPDRGVGDNVVLRHDGGTITDVSEGAGTARGRRSFVIPAFVNAHDHARATASSFGAVGMPLESWILRTALGTPVDPYLAAASALARSAKAGCAAVMVHYTRPSGMMPLLDEAKAIARAASDVGIRIAFAMAVRDQNPIVYGDAEPVLSGLSKDGRKTIEDIFVRAPMSPRAYIELTDAIAAAIAGPMVDVQLGPAGVQWCSKPLLEAVAESSARTGRRIHMHLLETVYQRAWVDQHFPDMVSWLRDIGFLSERLTLAHCIYARPDELEMIAAAGARIVTNFSSNMHLRSGLAPIAAAHKCGCAIAVGVDGLALDEDDDILREMRLVQMVHGGLGFKQTWTAAEMFALAIRNGRRATGAPGSGELAAGNPADYVVVDLDRLDRDQIMPVDPMVLLFARGNASLVNEVVVAGRTIVRDGACAGVDLPVIEDELRGMYRANLGKFANFQRTWLPLSERLSGWFEQQLTCG